AVGFATEHRWTASRDFARVVIVFVAPSDDPEKRRLKMAKSVPPWDARCRNRADLARSSTRRNSLPQLATTPPPKRSYVRRPPCRRPPLAPFIRTSPTL